MQFKTLLLTNLQFNKKKVTRVVGEKGLERRYITIMEEKI